MGQPSCWRRWRCWWLYFLGTLSCSDAELFGGHAPTCGQSRQRPSQLVGTRHELHSSPFLEAIGSAARQSSTGCYLLARADKRFPLPVGSCRCPYYRADTVLNLVVVQ